MESTKELLRDARVIAVVGLSSKSWRPSHGVSEYMQAQGYRIVPVNPREAEVLGEKAYPSLEEVPEPIDIVNVFRNSRHALEVVEAAIRAGAKAVWMQQGVSSEEAAQIARQAGLAVVMDRCIMLEHRRLFR
jgi:uncharacterized protein